MKNGNEQKHVAHPTDAKAAAISRYQIYSQNRAGVFSPGFSTDSAHEIVGAFLNQSPAFEGGELRIWNHREQQMSASVAWTREKTDFGFPVRHRTNVFHDRLLGVIARQAQVREEMCEAIQESVRINA